MINQMFLVLYMIVNSILYHGDIVTLSFHVQFLPFRI